ncbi:TPA: preprotein translocase subunit SecE [Patescibacteria group bacterium]|nr:preprotein translocase subunit SecE [Patescibacteria group bacterium]
MEKPTMPAFTANPLQFIKEVQQELKKVTWPTRQETIKLTGVVIIISLIVAFFIGGLDAGVLKLTSTLYKR